MEVRLDNYLNEMDTFIESIEIPINPISVLANTDTCYWELIGGGNLSEREYQQVKLGVSKRIIFNMDSHFSVHYCVENVNCIPIYINCSQHLNSSGRYRIDNVQKVIIFTESSGSKSTMRLITLNRYRLVLEDGDKFRYYYQATQLGQELNLQG